MKSAIISWVGSFIWDSSCEGTYHIGKQQRLRRACSLSRAFAVHSQYSEQEEASDKEPNIWPHWMLEHAVQRKRNHAKLRFHETAHLFSWWAAGRDENLPINFLWFYSPIWAACPRLARFFCLTASLILSTSCWYLRNKLGNVQLWFGRETDKAGIWD